MTTWFILFIYCITAYGVSNHFVYAHGPMHVYDKIRSAAERIHPNVGELFNCFICFPTWVGMVARVGNMLLMPTLQVTPFMMIAYGLLSRVMFQDASRFSHLVDVIGEDDIVWIAHRYEGSTLQTHPLPLP